MFMTVEEFLASSVPDGKAELVRGKLRVTPPPGAPHGVAGSNLVFMLGSFVRAERLPAEGIGAGFLKFAPDLAIEVLSPSETASELEEKLDDYLFSGTQLIWVVDPVRRTVMIVAADTPVRWLREDDTLDGGTVVPGFTCPVSVIFEGIARDTPG
jgi:Uma2 family endonuclease